MLPQRSSVLKAAKPLRHIFRFFTFVPPLEQRLPLLRRIRPYDDFLLRLYGNTVKVTKAAQGKSFEQKCPGHENKCPGRYFDFLFLFRERLQQRNGQGSAFRSLGIEGCEHFRCNRTFLIVNDFPVPIEYDGLRQG